MDIYQHVVILLEVYLYQILTYLSKWRIYIYLIHITWTINKKHASKLMATEMDYWRREKIRNVDIMEIMQVEKNVLVVIEERRLRWYGHINRMPGDRIPKMMMEWLVDGRGKKGRSKECSMDGVKRSMNKRGFNEKTSMTVTTGDRKFFEGAGKPL